MRYPWLPKGIRFLQDGGNFADSDAFIDLGVGKNMANAIRHWCRVTGMTQLVERGSPDEVTDLGSQLLGVWDPYLEDPGTLWLLHWQLVKDPGAASSWFLIFTQWIGDSFTRSGVADWLLKLAKESGARATKNSIKRDVDVFVRTYCPSITTSTRPLEDTFDSPLVSLGLLLETEKDTYRFARGSKPMLPEAIFLYALLDFWQRQAPDQNTLAFERVLHGSGSPGAAFKFSSNALVERLESLPASAGIRFDTTAGLRQLLRSKDVAPLDALSDYYGAEKRVA